MIAADCGLHADALCRELMINWDELRTLAADPLATVGAQTRSHLELAILDTQIARDEMADRSGASSKSWSVPAIISAIPTTALPAPARANSRWPARWACAPRSRPARARSMRPTPTARPN
jgi:hypothetical protein